MHRPTSNRYAIDSIDDLPYLVGIEGHDMIRWTMALMIVIGGTAVPQFAAEAQTLPGAQPIVESCDGSPPSPQSYCERLVNRDKLNRIVVTLKTAPDFNPLAMIDRRGSTVELREEVRPVLLLPGQSLTLPKKLAYSTDPQGSKFVTFTNTILGSYQPNPNLGELPRPLAEDSIRFYERVNTTAPAIPSCTPKYGANMWGMGVRNFNISHRIAVTFRSNVQYFGHDWQTAYLGPGEEVPMSCYTNWSTDIEIKEIRYAD